MIDAGQLRERLDILDLFTSDSGCRWEPTRQTWAKVEQTGERNLFSGVGIGARDVKITLREQRITLHNALRWKGQHLFLTEITRPDPGWMEIKAALVDVTQWEATHYETGIDTAQHNRPKRTAGPPITFPAVLTEKYMGYTPPFDQGHASTEARFVLVTSKPVELSPGDLVAQKVGEAKMTYKVELAHSLDGHKNEYEISRRKDV